MRNKTIKGYAVYWHNLNHLSLLPVYKTKKEALESEHYNPDDGDQIYKIKILCSKILLK